MELTKEFLDVDLYVDPRPMTKEDVKLISDYIKTDKLNREKNSKRRNSTTKSRVSRPESKQKSTT